MLILTTKLRFTFNMTCLTFAFLKILLVGRFIRSSLMLTQLLLSCWITIAESFIYNCNIYHLALTASGCYSTNIGPFTYSNDKLFSHELKTLHYDGLWENKKLSDKIWLFDWIKLIDWYRWCSSDIASSYFSRPSKVTEHVTLRVSGASSEWNKRNLTLTLTLNLL